MPLTEKRKKELREKSKEVGKEVEKKGIFKYMEKDKPVRKKVGK